MSNFQFVFKPVQATNPTIPDNKYQPNKIMHEWSCSGYQTGDASAGSVYGYIDFGSYFDSKHYIAITFITFHSTANTTLSINTHTDRWNNYYMPGFANRAIGLYKSQGTYTPNVVDYIKKPLYLGRYRPQDANPGRVDINYSTNTDSAEYNILIQGYTLERPLPFTSILQP